MYVIHHQLIFPLYNKRISAKNVPYILQNLGIFTKKLNSVLTFIGNYYHYFPNYCYNKSEAHDLIQCGKFMCVVPPEYFFVR